MYSRFQLAKKYLDYYFTANNGKGHGIHSPFVFDFVIHVLNDKKIYDCYDKIELLRNQLHRNNTIIEVEDFGAGSTIMHQPTGQAGTQKRKINAIANTSLKNKKFAQLLFKMVQYYNPETIIELGTSFGITTSYIAFANKNAEVYTFEGSQKIAAIANENFNQLKLLNIRLIKGNFDDTFLPALHEIKKIDFAFIDGNHRKEPTLNYFFSLLKKSTAHSIFVFDDIHWSTEMEEAWKLIQQHDSVKLTIDLFFIGIVFFNPDFIIKQHFAIRF